MKEEQGVRWRKGGVIFSKKVIDEESDTTGGRQVGWGKEITGEEQKGRRHTGAH